MSLSYWQQNSFHAPQHLVVVGSGIVGCFAALFYKRHRPMDRVMVLERGPYPDGASLKNAGFACFGSPTELLADIANEGEDVAIERVEQRWAGLALLRQELRDDAIGYVASGGYEMFKENAQFLNAREHIPELNELLKGIIGPYVFTLDPMPLADRFSEKVNLISNAYEGQVDSGLLMHHLIRKCGEAGVEFRYCSQVSGVVSNGDHAVVSLGSGEALRAEQVLLATNGYSGDLVPEKDLLPARGQILLTAPIPGLKLKGSFHYDRGYYYFRNVGDRILLGGGRELDIAGETTIQEETTPIIQAALEKLLRDHILPGSTVPIAQRWSGIMGVGKEKSPIVKRVNEHVTIAVRLGGMGVAIGSMVAQRAAAVIAGK